MLMYLLDDDMKKGQVQSVLYTVLQYEYTITTVYAASKETPSA